MLSVSKYTVPQDNPTPNPQQINFVGLLHLSRNSVTMVSGMDAEEVLPKCSIQEGTFSAVNLSFLAIILFIFMFAWWSMR